VINRALDVIEQGRCSAKVLGFSLGEGREEETRAVLQVHGPSPADLQEVVKEVVKVVKASGCTCRQAESDLPLEGFSQIRRPPAGPRRTVLVLGAGDIAALLSLASFEGQVEATDLDLGKEQGRLDGMVKSFDLVISLVPMPLHPVAAKACIKHRKPMVTASYVSPQMAELDEAAVDAGVLILNEMGVDPGIDHMSALAMIAEAEKTHI